MRRPPAYQQRRPKAGAASLLAVAAAAWQPAAAPSRPSRPTLRPLDAPDEEPLNQPLPTARRPINRVIWVALALVVGVGAWLAYSRTPGGATVHTSAADGAPSAEANADGSPAAKASAAPVAMPSLPGALPSEGALAAAGNSAAPSAAPPLPPLAPGALPSPPLGLAEASTASAIAVEAEIAIPGAAVPTAWLQAQVAAYRAKLPPGALVEPSQLKLEELLPPAVCASMGAPAGTRVLLINGQPPGAVGALDLKGVRFEQPDAGPDAPPTRLELTLLLPSGERRVEVRPLRP